MGDLSKNYSRHEWSCGCGCEFDIVDAELIYVMQTHISDYYGVVVDVTGGNRCIPHNNSTPGAARFSLHTEGKAADFRVRGVSPRAVYKRLNELFPDKYGLGLYEDRVHFDVRPDRARWNCTQRALPQ